MIWINWIQVQCLPEIEETESELVEPEPTKTKPKRNIKMNDIPARESDLFLGFSKPLPPGPSKIGKCILNTPLILEILVKLKEYYFWIVERNNLIGIIYGK